MRSTKDSSWSERLIGWLISTLVYALAGLLFLVLYAWAGTGMWNDLGVPLFDGVGATAVSFREMFGLAVLVWLFFGFAFSMGLLMKACFKSDKDTEDSADKENGE